MLKLAYNTTDSAVVDEQGYSVGGQQWGVVDTTDPITQADFDAGRLIEVDEDQAGKSDRPEVVEAVEALKHRRDKVKKAKAKDKDVLIDALDPEVVDGLPVGASGEPSKDDLVDAVVATDADLPAKSAKSAKKSSAPRRGQK